jgi:hypothetical protein
MFWASDEHFGTKHCLAQSPFDHHLKMAAEAT